MSMTLEQLRTQLSAIEPNESTYRGIGPSEIPLLEQLLQDQESWMASRAVFALSKLSDARAVALLSQAATDSRQAVRVSVAASVRNLRSGDANQILIKLLDDADLGVRKFAVQAVSETHDPTVQAKLRAISDQDPSLPMRTIVQDKLRSLRLMEP